MKKIIFLLGLCWITTSQVLAQETKFPPTSGNSVTNKQIANNLLPFIRTNWDSLKYYPQGQSRYYEDTLFLKTTDLGAKGISPHNPDSGSIVWRKVYADGIARADNGNVITTQYIDDAITELYSLIGGETDSAAFEKVKGYFEDFECVYLTSRYDAGEEKSFIQIRLDYACLADSIGGGGGGGAYLPLAGGTMTGPIVFDDDVSSVINLNNDGLTIENQDASALSWFYPSNWTLAETNASLQFNAFGITHVQQAFRQTNITFAEQTVNGTLEIVFPANSGTVALAGDPLGFLSSDVDPTADEIPDGYYALWENTTLNSTDFWINKGGVVSKVGSSGGTASDADSLGGLPAASYEVISNKATNTSLGTSNTMYPTQNAVKVYVDNLVALTQQSHTSGTTVTISNATGPIWLIVNPASTLATLTITLPTGVDGQRVDVSFGGTLTSGTVVTAVSFSPTPLQASTPTLVEAGEIISYRWKASVSKWYRIN